MDASLTHLLESNLQWIFVGGKGGVGKTTTSCSLATLFATTPIADPQAPGGTRGRRVLLISTDPAHNLSDAFDQKLGKTPTPVKGLEQNLSVMEVDPHDLVQGKATGLLETEATGRCSGPLAAVSSILKEAAEHLPGIDEITVFAEILREARQLSFDVVLFDTAPTGHTLRLLAFPQTLNGTLEKIMSLDGFLPLLEVASSAFSCASGEENPFQDDNLKSILTTWRDQIKDVQKHFNDPEKTSFVCVCIPEFLSVYETERLVQELMKYNINCDSIVVNQLVLKAASAPPCRMCEARMKVQGKYLNQIDVLYEDFHVVKMPLLSEEVRGVPALQQFARFLVEPYDPDKHGDIDAGSC